MMGQNLNRVDQKIIKILNNSIRIPSEEITSGLRIDHDVSNIVIKK